MATISGSIMIALSEVLVDQFEGINTVQHFLTASILSVPGAIMYAEIMYPSEEITHQIEDIKEEKIYSGSMDAITKGTKDGCFCHSAADPSTIFFVSKSIFWTCWAA